MTSQFTRVADMPNRRRLRSASSNQLDVPSFRLPTVGSRAFPIAGVRSGTAYQTMSLPLRPCQSFGAIGRHTYSAAVTTLSDTARSYSVYSGPRGGVAA